MVDLTKYLPEYPDISSDTFYQDIYRKEEFYELSKLPFDVRDKSGHYPHQDIISRFMSNWTLYENLLLIHDTGTGKSVSATATYDSLASLRPGMKMLYIVNNDNSLENFKQQLMMHSKVLKSGFKEYLKEKKLENMVEDAEKYSMYRNKFLREAGCEFYTYFKFSHLLEKNMNSQLQLWNHQFIIMDELHHLIVQDMEKKSEKSLEKKLLGKTEMPSYKMIYSFVKRLDKKKILYMTATPMRNSPDEIVPILNLMLKTPLPEGEAFNRYYFNIEGIEGNIPLYKWKNAETKSEFMSRLKGLVSVVRQRTPVPKQFMGYIYSPMKYFKLVMHPMSEFQSEHYIKAFLKDQTSSAGKKKLDSSFFSNSTQASLFVFPNGSYGIKPSESYFTSRKYFSPLFFKEFGFHKKATNQEEIRQRLDRIKEFGTTYSFIIQQIIHNPDKLIYVYCDKINGSGIWTCILLLNVFFGYQIITSPLQFHAKDWNNPNIKRCIFLNDVSEDAKNRKDVIDLIEKIFNNEKNKNGDFVQVIFGTDKTREGITLKRIQQIHVVSPDWNFGKIFQAIGRGIRLKSHEGLQSPNVDIYFHCSFPDIASTKEISIDLLTDENVPEEDFFLEEETIADIKSPSGNIEENPLDHYTPVGSEEDDEMQQLLSELRIMEQEEKPMKHVIQKHQLGLSIQFYKYYRSELRDRNIKLIEYALLVSAFDCKLNYIHNLLPRDEWKEKDNTSECYYTKCLYHCLDIGDDPIVIDHSTYNLYYIQEYMQEMIDLVRECFYVDSIMKLDILLEKCCADRSPLKTFSPLQIIDALRFMIRKPVKIPRFDGRFLYLVSQDKLVFVVESPLLLTMNPYHLSAEIFSNRVSFVMNYSLPEIQQLLSINREYVHYFLNRMNEMLTKDWPKYQQRAKYLYENADVQMKIAFLQVCMYEKDILHCSKISKWTEKTLTRHSEKENAYILFSEPFSYWFDRNEWGKYEKSSGVSSSLQRASLQTRGEEKDFIHHDDKDFLDTYVVNNKFHVYGFFAPATSRNAGGKLGKGTDIFKIRDVRNIDVILKNDKKNKTKGKACSSYRTSELLLFLYLLEQRYEWLGQYNKRTDVENKILEKITQNRQRYSQYTISNRIKMAKNNIFDEFVKELPSQYKSQIKADPLWFLVFYQFSKSQLCALLQYILKYRNLIVKPPVSE